MLLLTHSTLSIPGRRIGVHVRATFLAPPPAANPTEDHFFVPVDGHYPHAHAGGGEASGVRRHVVVARDAVTTGMPKRGNVRMALADAATSGARDDVRLLSASSVQAVAVHHSRTMAVARPSQGNSRVAASLEPSFTHAAVSQPAPSDALGNPPGDAAPPQPPPRPVAAPPPRRSVSPPAVQRTTAASDTSAVAAASPPHPHQPATSDAHTAPPSAAGLSTPPRGALVTLGGGEPPAVALVESVARVEAAKVALRQAQGRLTLAERVRTEVEQSLTGLAKQRTEAVAQLSAAQARVVRCRRQYVAHCVEHSIKPAAVAEADVASLELSIERREGGGDGKAGGDGDGGGVAPCHATPKVSNPATHEGGNTALALRNIGILIRRAASLQGSVAALQASIASATDELHSLDRQVADARLAVHAAKEAVQTARNWRMCCELADHVVSSVDLTPLAVVSPQVGSDGDGGGGGDGGGDGGGGGVGVGGNSSLFLLRVRPRAAAEGPSGARLLAAQHAARAVHLCYENEVGGTSSAEAGAGTGIGTGTGTGAVAVVWECILDRPPKG